MSSLVELFEVAKTILDNVPYEDINRFCAISQAFNVVCRNPEYWRHRLIRDYNVMAKTDNPREEYLSWFSRDKCTYGSERHRDLSDCLREANRRNDRRLFEYYVNLAIDTKSVGPEIYFEVAKGNRIDLLDRLLVSFSIGNYNPILAGAASGGHFNLVNRAIQLGANDINAAIVSAAEGGHLNVMKVLNKINPLNQSEHAIIQNAIIRAATNNHKSVVAYLFDIVDTLNLPPLTFVATALRGFSVGGHRKSMSEIIKFIHPLPRSILQDILDDVLLNVAEFGMDKNPKIVDMLLKAGATRVDTALMLAIKSNNIGIAKELLKWNPEIGAALISAASLGYNNIVVEILDRIRSGEMTEALSEALIQASKYGHNKVVSQLVRHGDLTIETLNNALRESMEPKVVIELIRGGAVPTDEMLIQAVEEDKTDVINEMLNHGMFSIDGLKMALDIATRRKQWDAVNKLSKRMRGI